MLDWAIASSVCLGDNKLLRMLLLGLEISDNLRVLDTDSDFPLLESVEGIILRLKLPTDSGA
jgi:hypothetical protein